MSPATDWVWVPELGRWGVDFGVYDNSKWIDAPKTLLSGISAVSFTAWIRQDTDDRADIFLRNLSTSDNKYLFQIDCVSTIWWVLSVPGDSVSFTYFPEKQGEWRPVTITYNYLTGHAQAYFDGVLFDEATLPDATLGVTESDPAQYCRLGTARFDSLAAAVADPLIHYRVLTADEVGQLHDPSNVMLSGLLQAPSRRYFPVAQTTVAAPTVTINDLTTNDTTPTLTGTVSDSGATVSVEVNSNTYSATVDGSGDWSATVTDALAENTYSPTVTATNAGGSDSATGSLTIQGGPGVVSNPTNGLIQKILQADFTQNTDNEWISPDAVGDQRRDLRSGGYLALNGTDNEVASATGELLDMTGDFYIKTVFFAPADYDDNLSVFEFGRIASRGGVTIYQGAVGTTYQIQIFLTPSGGGSYLMSKVLFPTGNYSEGDLLEVEITREGSTTTATGINHTTGYTNTATDTTSGGDLTPDPDATLLIKGDAHNVGLVYLAAGADAANLSFEYHFDEGNSDKVYNTKSDSGYGDLTITGTLTSIHQIDIRCRSWHNEVGYNLSGSTYIPRLETAANLALDPTSQTDALGNTLTYYGRAKYDGLLKSNCLETNGTDNLIVDSDTISIGAADFYFRFIVTADVNAGVAGYYLRTGATGSSGTLSIYRNSSGDIVLLMGQQDGSYAASPTFFASGEYSDGDLLEFVFSRTGTDFSYTATNHTTGLVNTGSLTRNEDFSPSGNLTLASASTATTYYVLQIGTSSSSLSHEYTFSEGDGAINYDRVGTNHLTWGGATGSLWTKSEYQEPYNNKNGFDRWNTASDGSGTDLFVPLQSGGTSIKGSGDTISGYTWQEKAAGSDKYHNGSETEIYQPADCPQLYDIDQNDFTTAIWYNAAGVPQAVPESDFENNRDDILFITGGDPWGPWRVDTGIAAAQRLVRTHWVPVIAARMG
jgi:hypothetical protein